MALGVPILKHFRVTYRYCFSGAIVCGSGLNFVPSFLVDRGLTSLCI